MNFSTDRDLLAHEPNVFNDVPVVAQQRLSVTDATVSGTTLTSASANFAAAGVEGGSVVLIGDTACEVIDRAAATTLEISLLRTGPGDAPIPPGDRAELSVKVRTFAPQAAIVHGVLLRMLGIEPDDPEALFDEDRIVSQSVMARLEALGTLERIYSMAAAITGDNRELLNKAQDYRDRFNSACRESWVLLDADGDGRADTLRSPGVVNLVRR